MSVNRLGIFVFYDQYGKADKYVEVLLKALHPLFRRLIITVNGQANDAALEMFSKYSKEIYIRENRGYDGGAYKDTILQYLRDENWSDWDELVMFNDTFYGPIHPFENVFELMEKQEVDFWGLCRYPKGGTFCGKELLSHIQSYFLVVNEKMLQGEDFLEFWRSLTYPQTLAEAILNFEIEFTTYFSNKGYDYTSYVDLVSNKELLECGGNPTYINVYELLVKINFPIIKKKSLKWSNFIEVKKVFDYVDENTSYEIEMIYENLKRKYVDEGILGLDYKALERFVKDAGRVFIYGNGKWGKNLQALFKYKNWDYAGVIVSSKGEEKGIYEYQEMYFNEDDYVVLALGKEAFKEVYPVIKKDMKAEKIFCAEQFDLD